MRLRLNKKDKLRFKAQFDRIRRDGVKSAGPAIVAVVMPIPEGRAACGVICSRKYSLKSVVRNRARRLLWESFRMLKPELSPCHILLIPRRKLMKVFNISYPIFGQKARKIRNENCGSFPMLSYLAV